MSAACAINSTVLPYGGDVTPAQAWEALQKNDQAILIDVRTQPEWIFSGLPNLSDISKKTQTVSWKIYPTMEVNPQFVDMIKSVVPDTETPIYCLCKTGGRSLDAAVALTEVGYTQCFNIAGGFEGDRNERGQRGTISGWKASNLPWEQA
ncbi:MAG: hypothetical protein MRY32_05575 [Rickettsiales bacterium]|nr:hypothetical protein [Rickettsiales bacterium]